MMISWYDAEKPKQEKSKKKSKSKIKKFIPPAAWVERLLYLHLCILQTIFSSHLIEGDVERLEIHIKEHNSLVKKTFPKASYQNKPHHFMHYSESIRQNGPLKCYWTARFESFHQELKRVSYVSRNFINLPSLLANHLKWVFSYDHSYSKTAPVPRGGYHKRINFNGFLYQEHVMLVCIGVCEIGPIFGEIDEIFFDSEINTLKFTVTTFKTIRLDVTLNAYEVEKGHEKFSLNYDSLHWGKQPHVLWKKSTKSTNSFQTFISARYLFNYD